MITLFRYLKGIRTLIDVGLTVIVNALQIKNAFLYRGNSIRHVVVYMFSGSFIFYENDFVQIPIPAIHREKD